MEENIRVNATRQYLVPVPQNLYNSFFEMKKLRDNRSGGNGYSWAAFFRNVYLFMIEKGYNPDKNYGVKE